MKLLDKKSRLTATVPVLVMVLCLVAAQAVARISPEALERVEAAAAGGDGGALHAAAYQATGNAVENGMAAQDACSQIALVAASTASDSGHSIESAVRSAVNGVNAAANEAAKASATEQTQVLELDTYDCAVNAVQTAAQAMGLEEDALIALRDAMSSFLPEPKMPPAPVMETPDIRDRSSGSPI
jgi:hypothetical protein